MNVLLKFDYESHLLHIPDGYVSSLQTIYENFFPWLYNQEKNMVETSDGGIGCAYNASDFLEYVNNIVLANHNERAYFLKHGHADKYLEF